MHLLEDKSGVRKVQPGENMRYVYNLPVYEEIKDFGLGQPITHHDIDVTVSKRVVAGIRSFGFLMNVLGDRFEVGMESDSTMEALFRFIYLYEKVYNRDKLRFMNRVSLSEFEELA